jgi:F-type H+-transporting ATPase subunit epsilon
VKKVFEGEAKEVILPGEDGEFSVMDFHQPCLYRLRAGRAKATLRNASGGTAEKIITLKQGLADIRPDKLILMIED